jgi:hypothetical protein
MPFKLTNTSNTFTGLTIGKFIMFYFNDIMIYNKNLEEHVEHLRINWLFCKNNIYLLIWKNKTFTWKKLYY